MNPTRNRSSIIYLLLFIAIITMVVYNFQQNSTTQEVLSINQVAADISTARADAEQQITMSKRAVEIATNNAQAEVAPLRELSLTLGKIKEGGGSSALKAYLRNMRIPLLKRANRIVEVSS